MNRSGVELVEAPSDLLVQARLDPFGLYVQALEEGSSQRCTVGLVEVQGLLEELSG